MKEQTLEWFSSLVIEPVRKFDPVRAEHLEVGWVNARSDAIRELVKEVRRLNGEKEEATAREPHDVRMRHFAELLRSLCIVSGLELRTCTCCRGLRAFDATTGEQLASQILAAPRAVSYRLETDRDHEIVIPEGAEPPALG